jgi:hypothetical protein
MSSKYCPFSLSPTMACSSTMMWVGRTGGIPFDKPEWPKKASDPVGHPVSHTMDEHIELDVKVGFTGPRSKRSILGTLTGIDAKDGTKVFERRWRFRRGEQTIRVASAKPLPKKVQRLDVD